ncbi:multicopper oxidase domain-containing protein [bacterium]|nr:multicopper oxidase domain-containing protein [bacterium]
MRSRAGMSRRALLRAGAAGAAGLALGTTARRATAHSPAAYVPRPDPTQYVLRVGATMQNPDGARAVPAVTADGALPGPTIRAREGDLLRIQVENHLADSPTSIHWHGLLVPAAMDGVPDVSTLPTAPGRVSVYEFPLRQSGTYWWHSHWGFQEQVGLFGPLVIDAADAPAPAHDPVVMLSDWLHRSPAAVFAALRGAAGAATPDARPMAAMKQPMAGTAGGSEAMAGRPMGGMDTPDLSDVTYDAFLLNGKGRNAPWSYAAPVGEAIRLRLVNAAGSTYFRVRLDGHPLRITHADGLAVEPLEVDHLLMGMAECYDAEVVLSTPGAYTLHAVAQDGSGQAVGVLHTPDVAPQANLAMPAFDGRALGYAALRAAAPTTLPDGPQRAFDLPLQGDMARYRWMIAGQAYPDADPLPIREGDRVQVTMRNETGMWHPMHLHGHFFRLLQGGGDRCPLKHTVNVAPGETVRIEFLADNPGNWFFHCHNVYHLEAGMARQFQYAV